MIGRAIESDVASKAAARVMIHSERKARRNPLVGLKTGATGSRGGRFAVGFSGGIMTLDEELSVWSGLKGFSAISIWLGVAMETEFDKVEVERVN